MGKQIVVCLDGTGNRLAQDSTNVLRMFRALSQDKNSAIAFYDPGLGTFGLKEALFEFQKFPAKALGLMVGWGISRVVFDAYAFVAQNYVPGDQIFIFGFSRGSYTARVLAAMLHAMGLLPPHQLQLLDYAWALLKNRKDGKPDFGLQKKFKATFSSEIEIDFLGLFDTVKSVGWLYDPLVVPYTANNPSVRYIRHAVAVDERRCFFRQHLWSTTPDPRTDLKEVWFPGVHSDIGGGYPDSESSLSLIPFEWMVQEANNQGLKFDEAALQTQLNVDGGGLVRYQQPQHQSLRGPWYIAEWIPRWAAKGRTDHGRHVEMGACPLAWRLFKSREIDSDAQIHPSVWRRKQALPSYLPPNLPPQTPPDNLSS